MVLRIWRQCGSQTGNLGEDRRRGILLHELNTCVLFSGVKARGVMPNDQRRRVVRPAAGKINETTGVEGSS